MCIGFLHKGHKAPIQEGLEKAAQCHVAGPTRIGMDFNLDLPNVDRFADPVFIRDPFAPNEHGNSIRE